MKLSIIILVFVPIILARSHDKGKRPALFQCLKQCRSGKEFWQGLDNSRDCLPLCLEAKSVAGHARKSETKRLFVNLEFEQDVQVLLTRVAPDASKGTCVHECTTMILQGQSFHYGCQLLCNVFQTVIEYMQFTSTTPKPQQGPKSVAGHARKSEAKKMLFVPDFQAVEDFKEDALVLLTRVASDASRDTCLHECTRMTSQGQTFHNDCEILCFYFQTVLPMMHLTSTPKPQQEAKRLFVNTLRPDEDVSLLREDAQVLLDRIGTTSISEGTCLHECNTMAFKGHKFSFECPRLCYLFRTVVPSLDLTQTTPRPQ